MKYFYCLLLLFCYVSIVFILHFLSFVELLACFVSYIVLIAWENISLVFLIKVVLMKKRVHVYETRTNDHSAAREIVIEQQFLQCLTDPNNFKNSVEISLRNLRFAGINCRERARNDLSWKKLSRKSRELSRDS